jgi:hypothetical protein
VFDCVIQKENILLNIKKKRTIGMLSGLVGYKYQHPSTIAPLWHIQEQFQAYFAEPKEKAYELSQ